MRPWQTEDSPAHARIQPVSMTRGILPVALAFIAVATVAVAQNAPGVQPDSRLRGPATFKTDPCVAAIPDEERDALKLAPVANDTFVLIDKRYRVSVRMMPFGTPRRITFSPH